MSPTPIISSAKMALEYIPTVQDSELYGRLKKNQLAKKEQALQRRIESGDISAEEIEQARQGIVDDRAFAARTIETMESTYPTPMVFVLQIPTSMEREQITSRMVSLGLSQVSQEQIRATMIEELFHVDWLLIGDSNADLNQVEAENNANFLDGVWIRQEAHNAAIQQWQEQETERMIDEAEGAPPIERLDLPVKIITVRETARMQLLVDRMMKDSQRLRDLAAQNMDFSRRSLMLMVRIHVLEARNVPLLAPLERDFVTRTLTQASGDMLREALDDATWNDLVGKIDSLYSVGASEEKNSDSPLEKLSPPNGSTEASGDQASKDGSSTVSSTGPAPEGESGKTIGTSSDSISASAADPVSTEESGSPTAVA